MFDWVLNTPLLLDGYYLHGLSSLYVHPVVPECFKNEFSRSKFYLFIYLFVYLFVCLFIYLFILFIKTLFTIDT